MFIKPKKGFSTVIAAMASLAVLAAAIVVFGQTIKKPITTPDQVPTPEPSPRLQASPSPKLQASPQAISSPTLGKVNIGEPFAMRAGDQTEIIGTGLKIKISEINTPQAGTFDLPSYVLGQATYQGLSENFNFTVGGNQLEELAQKRRQKDVFGRFNIYVQKVTSQEVTLIVKKING